MSTTSTATLLRTEAFIAQLARALHRFGSPAHRLEEAMAKLALRLGVEGEFFCTPTAIFASFRAPVGADGSGQPPHTTLLRVEPGEVNLTKLSRLDQVLLRVLGGQMSTEDASVAVEEIVKAPSRYGLGLTLLAFAATSAATARFFGGGIREALAAAAIGLAVGLFAVFIESRPATARIFEFGAAALAAFAATLTASFFDASFFIVTLSALIVLMPGLTLTTAVAELAMRHLASGSARLAGAFLVLMTMAVGFAFGGKLGQLLVGLPHASYPTPQATWSEILALIVSAASLLVLFRAEPRDFGPFLGAAALAYFGSRWGGLLLGPELGALVGALLIGIAANLFARWRDRPSALVQMPGLMLLVPGSMGFRSVAALLEQETVAGIQTGFTVVLVAISLATGLLAANALVSPRRLL